MIVEVAAALSSPLLYVGVRDGLALWRGKRRIDADILRQIAQPVIDRIKLAADNEKLRKESDKTRQQFAYSQRMLEDELHRRQDAEARAAAAVMANITKRRHRKFDHKYVNNNYISWNRGYYLEDLWADINE